ncbi:PREDICTED: estradiol 17-beta-dehydrogenase 11-like [Atta colombica]|uniref:estradiol 17-beta-dehydrogenase 11-like n=1 Tax=Atta colombica TaxID=520822 RepID=UPI00084C155B|nr:PREDICTED: estradiol 17-beta-dehydrogenase 11-like [Atta colombica]
MLSRITPPSDKVKITSADHIGKELAISYASLGATIVCWDISEELIMKSGRYLNNEKRFCVCIGNVADREEVLKVAKKVKEEVDDVTILINKKRDTFLSNMIKKDHGHIVMISSETGLFTNPYGTVYCPSKFAAIMYSLSEELCVLSNGKSSIKFTTIYLFFVCTGLIKKPKIR